MRKRAHYISLRYGQNHRHYLVHPSPVSTRRNRDPPTPQTAGAVRPPKNAPDLPKFVADNHLVTVTTTAYEKVKTIQAVLTEEDKGRKFTIRFSHRGKARLTVKDEAGNVHLEKEYSSAEEAVQTEEVKLKKKSGSVLVAVLELASLDGVTPAENRIFEVSYGRAEFEYGVVQALPVSFSTTVHSVRLFYTGTGVVFQVSTDGGTKWQKIEPGREVALDTPGTSLLVKILLPIDPATVLYDYRIDINPYHDMSFTGKFLEPEIGLIYFGGRWYEPGIGRWVTVDPAKDGVNWYTYCENDPINHIDPNGYFRNRLQVLKLFQGMVTEAAIIAVIAPIVTAAMPIIAPALPVLIPVFTICAAGTIINDTIYLIKNFTLVFFGEPTDAQVIKYGRCITRTVLTAFAIFKLGQAISAIKNVNNRIGITGKLGEDYLAKTYGGESQVGFNTSLGRRVVDQLTEGVAHESKVGYQSLTKVINRQIAKDVELLAKGEVKQVIWHFFISPITGKGGASQQLLQKLIDAGIKYIIH